VSPNQKQIYFKLIALWVICEAMLGGIIHGFKLPISGLVVGGSAVVCICLIGHLVPFKGAIIRATIVVAIFKMLLSPHSSFPAYIAVLFQGVCGELLFSSGKKNYQLKCYLLAFLALIESAIQRILVMTVLYGIEFWKAVNDFIGNLTKSDPSTNYSLYFVSIYLVLHLIAAFLIGRFCAAIPAMLRFTKEEIQPFIITLPIYVPETKLKKKRNKITFIVAIWLILASIYIYTLIYPNGVFSNGHASLKFIFRSAIILLTWYLILGPILLRLLKGWLEKRKGTYKKEIEEVVLLLPSTSALIKESWKRTEGRKGFSRIKDFWRLMIINTVVT
jgi:hypothetical protein